MFKINKYFLLSLFIILSLKIYAQNDFYNLPPGVKIQPKTNTKKDYSNKLSLAETLKSQTKFDFDFFEEFEKGELETLKKSSKEHKDYYESAEIFYKNLSWKVKSIYSNEELWYIYFFDEKLLEKLKNVR